DEYAFAGQKPRLAGQFRKLDLASARPWAFQSCYDEWPILIQKLQLQVLVHDRSRKTGEQKINSAITQLLKFMLHIVGRYYIHDDARILSGEAIDDGGNQAARKYVGTSDSDFADSRVVQSL